MGVQEGYLDRGLYLEDYFSPCIRRTLPRVWSERETRLAQTDGPRRAGVCRNLDRLSIAGFSGLCSA